MNTGSARSLVLRSGGQVRLKGQQQQHTSGCSVLRVCRLSFRLRAVSLIPCAHRKKKLFPLPSAGGKPLFPAPLPTDMLCVHGSSRAHAAPPVCLLLPVCRYFTPFFPSTEQAQAQTNTPRSHRHPPGPGSKKSTAQTIPFLAVLKYLASLMAQRRPSSFG
jgi:hypothetical protein